MTIYPGWLADARAIGVDSFSERPASSGSPTMQMKLAALKLRRLVSSVMVELDELNRNPPMFARISFRFCW